MADYPLTVETFSGYGAVSEDSVLLSAIPVFVQLHVPADSSYSQREIFTTAVGLGISICRGLGYYGFWMNKVWDSGAPGGGAWVMWETGPGPDPTGIEYPNPYGTGFINVYTSFRTWALEYLPGTDYTLYPPDIDYDEMYGG